MKILHIPTLIIYEWLGKESQMGFQSRPDTDWVWASGSGAFFSEDYNIHNWRGDATHAPAISIRKCEFTVVED